MDYYYSHHWQVTCKSPLQGRQLNTYGSFDTTAGCERLTGLEIKVAEKIVGVLVIGKYSSESESVLWKTSILSSEIYNFWGKNHMPSLHWL